MTYLPPKVWGEDLHERRVSVWAPLFLGAPTLYGRRCFYRRRCLYGRRPCMGAAVSIGAAVCMGADLYERRVWVWAPSFHERR